MDGFPGRILICSVLKSELQITICHRHSGIHFASPFGTKEDGSVYRLPRTVTLILKAFRLA